jgi:Kef-type K+ transport system membrane component KefB
MSSAAATVQPRLRNTVIGYALMIVAAILAFLAIRHFGEALPAPAAAQAVETVKAGGKGDVLYHVLLALAAVIVVGRLVAAAFKYVGQPPVIGEVLAGILLGPSLLGYLWPGATAYLLPPAIAPFLDVIAQFGVILYMFIVGLELDVGHLRQRGHTTLAISHASIVAPFLLGSLLALWLYPILAAGNVPFTPFALFLGVAMSITAFPVLARILTDRGISRTPLGVVALTCAATDDVTAWCLLALVVGVAQAKVGGALMVIVLTLVYIAAMLLVVRPLLLRIARGYLDGPPSQAKLAGVFVLLLSSTLITEAIGVHAIFGAFLLGAIMPHDSPLARELIHKLEDVVCVLLLPAFFALTGMRTQLNLVSGLENWLLCGLIILVATLGKFGGTFAAARLTGLGWREAASLGTLMNTRGLMELIVLNIGLEMRVISPRLFAMMVLMAIATTIATAPVLSRLWPQRGDATAPGS